MGRIKEHRSARRPSLAQAPAGHAICDITSTNRASHDHGGRAAAQLLDGTIAAVAIALWRYGKSEHQRSTGSGLTRTPLPVAPRHPDRYGAECASLRAPSRTQSHGQS
jgi:hypothetical protein